MKPKLYQYEACPFCNKIKTLLEYKGVDYETIEVHPLKKKEIAFSEQYKKVPIYIDASGKQVNDSTPIMRRIDEEFPEPKVFCSDSSAAEKEGKWLAWSETFVRGLPTAIYDTFSNSLKSFNYITKVGKFNWLEQKTIKYSGAFVMSLVSKKIKKREQIEDPNTFLREKAGQWAEGLGEKPFMAGDQPGAADIAVYGITRSVFGLGAADILNENQTFRAWIQRMQDSLQRPKVAV